MFKLPDHISHSRYHAGRRVVKDDQGTVLALKDSPMQLVLASRPSSGTHPMQPKVPQFVPQLNVDWVRRVLKSQV